MYKVNILLRVLKAVSIIFRGYFFCYSITSYYLKYYFMPADLKIGWSSALQMEAIIPVFLFTTSTFYQKNKEKKSNFLSIRNPRLISLFFLCEKMTVHQYRFEYFHLFFLNISRRHDILRVTKQFANFSESCRDGVTWQAQ